MVPVLVDWITVTHRDWAQYDHLTPVVIGMVCGDDAIPFRHRTGARGYRGNSAFVGFYDSGMMLIEATGCMAQAVADRVAKIPGQESMSVARIDLQATVWVADADSIITTVVPSRRYRCTIVRELYTRGCTLYVGAPASDARLRIYNKTAESGNAPAEGGEWLRVELQLRNRYADRAYLSWRKRAQGGLLNEYVRKMLDERTYRIVRDAIEHGEEQMLDQDTENDWVMRRLYWLEHTVVPALKRLALHDEWVRREIGIAFSVIMGLDVGAGTPVSGPDVQEGN